jgi:hypothetical protein
VSAFEVGQLAERLYGEYASYLAALAVARHRASEVVVNALVAENRGPARVPTYPIPRSDGSEHWFHLVHYFRVAQQSDEFHREYERLWLVGALLTLNDRLEDEGLFDGSPELELVKHLRNGVAHGNRFEVRVEPKPPAHLDGKFRVTRALHRQPVLFEFIGPGDVCDLLIAVGQHLLTRAEREKGAS